jgi:hypothetical protein
VPRSKGRIERHHHQWHSKNAKKESSVVDFSETGFIDGLSSQ